ncbi:hypothetical protein [Streptomyces sp. NPDC002057]|uniref:hypothetical protein n=1 Tax=Streptomyces sp. NPDC002057 TaxID=3154664 RepID=UPI003316A7A5
MSIVKAAVKRVRGMMKEADGKALQNPASEAAGKRMQQEARGEVAQHRSHRAGHPPSGK